MEKSLDKPWQAMGEEATLTKQLEASLAISNAWSNKDFQWI
jgi:hypothetical protein